MGYDLSYIPKHQADNKEVTKVHVKGADVKHHTIDKLEPYTEYLISLEVVNPEGNGPATTLTVMTDEGGTLRNTCK